MPCLVLRESSGNEIELTPDLESFNKATVVMQQDLGAKIIYQGYEYPWLCGLCPKALMRMIFMKETSCKSTECILLMEKLIENTKVSQR